MKQILLCAGCALALTGCGISAKPALPRRASMNSLGEEAADNFASRIKRADVIYFATEDFDRAAFDLIRALRDGTRPFAIAWQDLGADQQEILDHLKVSPDPDSRIAGQVTWNISVRSHASRDRILQTTSDLPQLAIGLPKILRAKLHAGRGLTTEERLLLPQGYLVPQTNFDASAEEHDNARGRNFPKADRVRMLANLFAAEKVVTFLKAHPDARLLVFLHRRDLEGSGSIPDFVTQKTNVRQLILDVGQRPADERPRLVTSLR